MDVFLVMLMSRWAKGSGLGPLLLSKFMLLLEDKLKELEKMSYTQMIQFFTLYSIRPSVNACLMKFDRNSTMVQAMQY